MWPVESFASLHPVTQALLAGLFTWGVTAVGAGLVFVTRRVSVSLFDAMLGFAAGIMIAASCGDIATLATLGGFAIMMVLDVALG